MSWPKKMLRLPRSRWWLEADNETDPVPPDLDAELVEVVPAVVARELYEAGEAFYLALHSKLDAALAGEDPVRTEDEEDRFKAALARYRDEVGS